jgi:hypothetical protein
LSGITDFPNYTKDYPEKTWEKEFREVLPSRPYFSDNGEEAILELRSRDNKDRWITLMDLETGELKSLDRQRDEAWINGPGIGYSFDGSALGWLPDNKHIYFQSEETGYSHFYILNVNSGDKKALTHGEFEVFDPKLSNDKKHWFLTTSEVHPGERHLYKMPVMGGNMEKLTQMMGNNEIYFYTFSTTTFIQKNSFHPAYGKFWIAFHFTTRYSHYSCTQNKTSLYRLAFWNLVFLDHNK